MGFYVQPSKSLTFSRGPEGLPCNHWLGECVLFQSSLFTEALPTSEHWFWSWGPSKIPQSLTFGTGTPPAWKNRKITNMNQIPPPSFGGSWVTWTLNFCLAKDRFKQQCQRVVAENARHKPDWGWRRCFFHLYLKLVDPPILFFEKQADGLRREVQIGQAAVAKYVDELGAALSSQFSFVGGMMRSTYNKFAKKVFKNPNLTLHQRGQLLESKVFSILRWNLGAWYNCAWHALELEHLKLLGLYLNGCGMAPGIVETTVHLKLFILNILG